MMRIDCWAGLETSFSTRFCRLISWTTPLVVQRPRAPWPPPCRLLSRRDDSCLGAIPPPASNPVPTSAHQCPPTTPVTREETQFHSSTPYSRYLKWTHPRHADTGSTILAKLFPESSRVSIIRSAYVSCLPVTSLRVFGGRPFELPQPSLPCT